VALTIRDMFARLRIRADSKGLEVTDKRIGKTTRKLSRAAREARRLRRDMRGLMFAAKATATALVASRALRWLTTDYASAADAAAKFAKATGVGVETYQALVHAVQLSGGDARDLQKGLMQIGKRARDASLGMKETADAFREIGINVRDGQGDLKRQDILLLEMADRFKAMPDGSRKTALAMEIFGRSGAKLIPMLNAGSKGIRDMMAEARRLGIVMTKEQAAAAENFQDEMLRTKGAIQGVRNIIAAKLLPTLTRHLRAFTRWAQQGDNIRRMLMRLTMAAKIAGGALAAMAVRRVWSGLAKGVSVLWRMARALRRVAAMSALANLRTTAMIAALVMIPLLIQDLWAWSQGGHDTIVGRLFGNSGPAVAEARQAFADIGAAAAELWASIKPALVEFWPPFRAAVSGLWKLIKPALPWIARIIGFAIFLSLKAITYIIKGIVWLVRHLISLFEWLGHVGARAARWIGDAWSSITGAISRAWQWLSDLLTGIWQGLRDIWNTIWSGATRAAVWVVQALANAWHAVADAARAAYKWTKKAIDATIGRLSKIAGKLRINGPDFERTIKAYRRAGHRAHISGGIGGGITVRPTAQIGSVHVTVNSAPSMSPAEVQRRVVKAAKEATQAAIEAAYANRRAVVTGAP